MTAKPQPTASSLTATIEGLRAGLGVEDIAVRTGFEADLIRLHVRALRSRGALIEILKGGEDV